MDLCIHPSPRRSYMQGDLYSVYRGLVEPALLVGLRAEAWAMHPQATESRVIEDRASEGRGGTPARAYFSAPGGPLQAAFYGAPWLSEMVARVTGHACSPTASGGTFNYYARPGDHLSLHRDVEGCDVAVITCLARRMASNCVAGGQLLLYPECAGRPLAAVRCARNAATVDLNEGETLVMLGGTVPHRLQPLGPGQERIVSVLCFRFC